MIIIYLNPKVAVVAVKLINNIVMGRSDNSLNHVIIIVVIKVYGKGKWSYWTFASENSQARFNVILE